MSKVEVFCIDGVVVRIDEQNAIARMPYDIMDIDTEPMMKTTLHNQGRRIPFLTPMTSDMMKMDFPECEIIENINKETANTVSTELSGKPIYGYDEDGVLHLGD